MHKSMSQMDENSKKQFEDIISSNAFDDQLAQQKQDELIRFKHGQRNRPAGSQPLQLGSYKQKSRKRK